MRILLTTDPELPVPPKMYGGIERIVDLLVRGLRVRGHEVGLVAHPESTVPADRLFAWPGRRSQHKADTALNMYSLWNATRTFRPDVLNSFSRQIYMLPVLRAGFPKLMSYQRKPGTRQVRWASRLAAGSLEFTGCSRHICREGEAAGGRWHTIHNGVDLANYAFSAAVPPGAPLVFLSRIERIKGTHTAIAIARRTGRRLLIAGNHGTDGEAGEYWRSVILPQIGKNNIEYIGPVDDAQKNALLGAAAAMIVPIEWDEPFGIVFAEALACGTPVIACPRGALPEIVRNGVDGFLVNDVAEGCKAVAALDQIRREDCRARAEACFSAPVIVGLYESVYARLVRPNE